MQQFADGAHTPIVGSGDSDATVQGIDIRSAPERPQNPLVRFVGALGIEQWRGDYESPVAPFGRQEPERGLHRYACPIERLQESRTFRDIAFYQCSRTHLSTPWRRSIMAA